MNRLLYAAALCATLVLGLFSFAFTLGGTAAIAKSAQAAEAAGADVKCYLLGCYDADGNPVDRATTASIATEARDAIGEANVKRGPKAQNFGEIIARHARANGVPLNLAHAVVRIESNYRANARGGAGEVGLMQIKPATARMMGYSGSTKALYHPETNVKYGMKYLGMAQKLGDGSVCGTILKYNAGHAAKRMNRISAAYCQKVKRHLGS